MPAKPAKGFLPLDEFEAKTVQEQQLLFKKFWDPSTHNYDSDNWRLSTDPKAPLNPRGNTAIVGVFFASKKQRLHIFEQKRLFNPLGTSITRKQWRIILRPLLWRDANWCWLPAIMDAYGSDDWCLYNCVGWNCYDEMIYQPKVGDMIMGPGVCKPRIDYKGREWIGALLLQDIITGQSNAQLQ